MVLVAQIGPDGSVFGLLRMLCFIIAAYISAEVGFHPLVFGGLNHLQESGAGVVAVVLETERFEEPEPAVPVLEDHHEVEIVATIVVGDFRVGLLEVFETVGEILDVTLIAATCMSPNSR